MNTDVTWHRRAEAYGDCLITAWSKNAGACVLANLQKRVVIKIAGTLYDPFGNDFPFQDTHGATIEQNRFGENVMDTADLSTSTGPGYQLIYSEGSFTFVSANVMQPTWCNIKPEMKYAPPVTIQGRAPRKKRCGGGNEFSVFGNPCDALDGVKFQAETDIRFGPLTLKRYYNSDTALFDLGHGLGWSSPLTRRLEIGTNKVNIVEANGQSESFQLRDGAWSGSWDSRYSLTNAEGGFLLRSREGTVEKFSSNGRLLSLSTREGNRLKFQYTDKSRLPNRVENMFGRGLNITHDGKHIMSVTPDQGASIIYGYGNDWTLASVAHANGEKRSNQYDMRPVGRYARAALLSGITDENGAKFAVWRYGADNKVISSEHAPGRPQGAVDKYLFNYNDAGDAGLNTVTDPLGVNWSLFYSTRNGQRLLARRSNSVNGAGISQTFDFFGYRDSFTDELGVRTCYVHDTDSHLETHRVEGVPPQEARDCGYLAKYTSQLPPGSRRIVTAWHPDWDLVVKRSEPGRVTTYVYNGQPDPFNGNTPAACAPVSAKLPDGKPIAVLCRQVEQATTDANGALGFNAALAPGVPARERRWTYNQYGQVLSHDGPRTDVADVESYTYYGETTAAYAAGDLASLTNALGQTTRFLRYDPLGQLLRSVGPDGVTTDYTYDARQRLTSVSTAGLTTTYAYDAVGQLKRVTQPDGSFVAYDYDEAHRLVAVSDSSGNRIDYTLDNAGHRTAEAVRDPRGLLRRRIDRVIDPLGRVQQVAGVQ